MDVPGQLAYHKLRSHPTRTTKASRIGRIQRPRVALILNSPRQKPAARSSNKPRIGWTKTTSDRRRRIALLLVNAVFVAKMRLLYRNSADSGDLRPAARRFLTRC